MGGLSLITQQRCSIYAIQRERHIATLKTCLVNTSFVAGARGLPGRRVVEDPPVAILGLVVKLVGPAGPEVAVEEQLLPQLLHRAVIAALWRGGEPAGQLGICCQRATVLLLHVGLGAGQQAIQRKLRQPSMVQEELCCCLVHSRRQCRTGGHHFGPRQLPLPQQVPACPEEPAKAHGKLLLDCQPLLGGEIVQQIDRWVMYCLPTCTRDWEGERWMWRGERAQRDCSRNAQPPEAGLPGGPPRGGRRP